eukprot:Gb_17683 [translate_table: standard]
MEAVMMAEGEGVFAESPTTMKEPIHCWTKSSKESQGCQKEPGDRRLTPRGWARGVGLSTGDSKRPGRGDPVGPKSRGGAWSYRSGIKKVVDLGLSLSAPHYPGRWKKGSDQPGRVRLGRYLQ